MLVYPHNFSKKAMNLGKSAVMPPISKLGLADLDKRLQYVGLRENAR
jgi:hypothetical protein